MGEVYSLVPSSYSPLKRTHQIRVQLTQSGETGRAGRGFSMRHCEFVRRSSVLSLSTKGGQAADESRYGLLCIPQFISPFPSCRAKPLCTNSFVCKLAFSYFLACASISILNHPSLLHLAPLDQFYCDYYLSYPDIACQYGKHAHAQTHLHTPTQRLRGERRRRKGAVRGLYAHIYTRVQESNTHMEIPVSDCNSLLSARFIVFHTNNIMLIESKKKECVRC